MTKYVVIAVLVLGIAACANSTSDKQAEMYDASELSQLMRDMVEFSKDAKEQLAKGGSIDSIPSHFWQLKSAVATRGEHEEAAFLGMADPYLEALKGIERGDSQAYYYQMSVDACKTCHAVYCSGPLSVINKL